MNSSEPDCSATRDSWLGYAAAPAALILPVTALYAPLGMTPLLLTFGVVAWIDIARQRRMPPATTLLAALVGLVIWAAVSTAWSIAPDSSLERVAKLAGLGVAAVGVIHGAGQIAPSRFRFIARWAIAGWAIATVLLVLDIVADGLLLRLIHGADDGPSQNFARYKRGVTVLMIHGWLMVGLLSKSRWSVLAVLCVAVPAILAYWIDARAVALAAAVGAVVAAIAWLTPRAARALPLLVGILVLVTPQLIDLAPRDATSVARDWPLSALHRIAIWHFAADRIRERPLLGWGLDSSGELPGGSDPAPLATWLEPHAESNDRIREALATLEETPPPLMPLHPHNLALQARLELGLPGALLVAMGLFLLGRSLFTSDDRTATAGGAGLYTAAILVAMLSFGMWQGWWLATIALTAAGARLVWRASGVQQ